VDTPDPYIVVHIREAPDGKKQSQQFDNQVNPCWDEELIYYLPPVTEGKIVAEVCVASGLAMLGLPCAGSLKTRTL